MQKITGTGAWCRASTMAGQSAGVLHDPRTSVEDQVVQYLSSSFSPNDHPTDVGSASPKIIAQVG